MPSLFKFMSLLCIVSSSSETLISLNLPNVPEEVRIQSTGQPCKRRILSSSIKFFTASAKAFMGRQGESLKKRNEQEKKWQNTNISSEQCPDAQFEIIPEIFEQQVIFVNDVATIIFEPKT